MRNSDRSQETRIWTSLKQYLEAAPASPGEKPRNFGLDVRGLTVGRLEGCGREFGPDFIRCQKDPTGNSRSLIFSKNPFSVRSPYGGAT